MIKKIFIFLFILISFNVSLFSASPTNFLNGKQVTIEAGEEINRDFYAAGNDISILGTINGDVYLFGAQVQIEGTVNGDVVVMGGMVEVSGKITRNLKVLGGHVSLSGEVGRNLSVAGGNVDLTESAKVNGGLYGKGGNFRIAAPIKGDVEVISGSFTQSGVVEGNVDLVSGDVRLAPGAKIEGNFEYWSDRGVSISRQAVISGKSYEKLSSKIFKDSTKKVIDAVYVIYLISKYISFISLFILGLLAYYFFPKYMRKTEEILQKTPWMALVTGVLFLLVPPILMIILIISVVGIPIALILLALYFLSLYVANIFAINFLGKSLMKVLGFAANDGWVFLSGLLIYTCLVSIPVIGYVSTFLAFLLGLGSLVMAKREMG
jgi:cytoskeletal protein CcmA (bactofilin family)